MKIKSGFILMFSICSYFLSSCNSITSTDDKIPILLADREAPLGWVYLRIYSDSSFEFESRGLRTSDIYPGKVLITKDSLFFDYLDSVPRAGTKAVFSDRFVAYTNGEYPEQVEINLNKLKN